VTPASTATAQRRIVSLASLTPVHRAFHWLHLHQPQIRNWLIELVRIPAPPFGEQARAAWFLERFQELGLCHPEIDAEGNVLAQLPCQSSPNGPILLLSAHLDTVFPAGTPCEPSQQGHRLLAPGICDNGAGLSALLGIAAALRYAEISPPVTILFAANVGEEGEGDLRGMRHLFTNSPFAGRLAAALALEGGGSTAVITRALGSLRLRVTVNGPGGHSWTDAGTPNPILLLSRMLVAASEELPLPPDPRTSLNIGHISGGTSINSIPETASALLDLRSISPGQLLSSAETLNQILRDAFARFSLPGLELRIDTIGNRPAAELPSDASLLETIRAVDRHLGLRTEPRIGSTDANLPLSLGIPAVALGAGGLGGGIHTVGEWYDTSGRETALRRILLTLLDTLQLLATSSGTSNRPS
jgi:acetylornithine deacetylase/succinyl-diaminopimelate desuccinylase-like protein